jgi:Uma2 family endonuclease
MFGNERLPLSASAEHIMAMPAIQKRRWTEREVRQLIDDAPEPMPRYELVDGDLLVTPSPSRMHQRIVLECVMRLQVYIVANSLGELLTSPSDVRLRPELVVQPDLYVVPAREGRRLPTTEMVTSLLLAIEVLSPGSARMDRVTKRRAYQQAGVPEYWVIDSDAQTIERWRPDDVRPEILDRTLVWHPAGAANPLELDLVAFFADVAD